MLVDHQRILIPILMQNPLKSAVGSALSVAARLVFHNVFWLLTAFANQKPPATARRELSVVPDCCTTWELEEREPPMKYLIRDHDTKSTQSFDTVFEAAGIEIVDIPYQAPNTNAFAERWVRSVREECLDRLIILNESHLRRVVKEYVAYFNERRPHQGLEQDSPLGLEPVSNEGVVGRRTVLGGIINDYYREAA